MKNILCALLIILSVIGIESKSSRSTQLSGGSFESYTYGKDGVILFYTDKSLQIYDEWLDAVQNTEVSEKINFWHLNCDIVRDFCDRRSEIKDITKPAIMYSFRNEPWLGKPVTSFKSHAFEVFFDVKANANCLNTPSLCTTLMNETLQECKNKTHAELKKAYENGEEEIKDFETMWEDYSSEVLRNYHIKKAAIQAGIEDLTTKAKIYNLLMENIHLEAYEGVENKVNDIVIDEETWNRVKNNKNNEL